MKKDNLEIIVGIFVLSGLLCMGYISIKLGQIDFFKKDYYPLKATFSSVAGLKPDNDVEIAGVKIGKVKDIKLDNYQALVTMLIDKKVKISEDAIAAIRSKGILGERYIEILPGASNNILKAGDLIFDTEPSFDLLTAIKKIALEK